MPAAVRVNGTLEHARVCLHSCTCLMQSCKTKLRKAFCWILCQVVNVMALFVSLSHTQSCWFDDTVGHYFNDGHESRHDHSFSYVRHCKMLKQAGFDPTMFVWLGCRIKLGKWFYFAVVKTLDFILCLTSKHGPSDLTTSLPRMSLIEQYV